MKIRLIFSLFFLLVMQLGLHAQGSNLILFSEQGEKFSVVLNGILQNPEPETNVKVTGLIAPQYKLKIIFENKSLADIDKNIFLAEDAEATYCIKKNNKGQYVVRLMTQVNIGQAPPTPPSQTIVVFSTVPPPPVTTTINQTTTTITVNAGLPGADANVPGGNHEHVMLETQKPYVMPGYSGPVGCPYPMTDLDFQDVKRTIASRNFEDSKLTIAKQVASSTCLFASEVKEILELFSFESSRLEFAKYAFKYTFDLGNYYKVNSAFQFESTIDELNDFINHSTH